MSTVSLTDVILHSQSALIQMDFWKEIFMIPERLTGEEVESRDGDLFSVSTRAPLYVGKLFVNNGYFCSIQSYTRVDDRSSTIKTYHVKAVRTDIPYLSNETKPLCTPQDKILLQPGIIANYPDGTTLNTTIGIFLANYLFFVYPFGDTIPYFNDTLSTSKLEKIIGPLILDEKVSVSDVKDKYINALALFGQANEIFCPGISEKTISIPDEIHQLRDKLVRENLAALQAGDASVMSDIETQLIKAYKEHIKGDPSENFLIKSKYYNVTLKKLFLTQGMVEQFGQSGKFSYVAQPMGLGWKQEDLPTIFNEVRQGSYARAIETADGGVIAKLILRVLQDSRITIPDCGTTRGDRLNGTKEQLNEFLYNYTIEPDGSNLIIDADRLPQLVGKDIVIRTPGYCQAKSGYCAKCFGKPFEVLGQKAFAPIANGFATAQTTSALKAMHGKSVSVVDVSNVNDFLLA